MTRHQRTTSVLLFIALLAAVLPSAALGNSLLSGYGGPGEGNQELLGSALVNSPKGGGSSGTGANGSGDSSIGQASSSQPAAASSGSHVADASKPAAAGHRSKHARSSKPAASGAAARASQGAAVIYPAASREVTAGGSRALGFSDADFVYIILALGVLALTALLTVRLTRTTITRRPDGHL